MPKRLTVVALAGFLALQVGTCAFALERTATKEVDQVSTDLNTEMKVTAFTESIRAAVQALIDRVNLFDGRIDALEAWRTGIDTSISGILSRLAALEARAPHLAYLYGGTGGIVR